MFDKMAKIQSPQFIKLAEPWPQILFWGGTAALLSSVPNCKYFGDATMGVAPQQQLGWNATALCQAEAPNAWWLYNPEAGVCPNGYPTVPPSQAAAIGSDVWVAHLKLGNGGPDVWGSSLTTTTCDKNFPYSCWALIPLEAAVVLGFFSGGFKI